MPKIFVNYRTGDTDGVAALVERELTARFGPRVMFRASTSIPLGDDFTRALMRAVRQSDALLAFIGPHWLDAGADGLRKIDYPDDWTRREIVEAFRTDVRVIPVLVGSVRPLRVADLPADLAPLAVCQYTRLDHRTQEADLDMLVAQLVELVPGLEERADDAGEAPPAPGGPGRPPGGDQAGRDVINAGGDVSTVTNANTYNNADTYHVGHVNHAGRDVNIGVQARDISGGVSIGHVGAQQRREEPRNAAPSGDEDE